MVEEKIKGKLRGYGVVNSLVTRRGYSHKAKVGDGGAICQLWVSHPDPNEPVALRQRELLDSRHRRNRSISVRVENTFPRRIESKSVIATFHNVIIDEMTETQRVPSF